MKNSKLRRILLTLACAVLLVSLSVGATLAYLTSTPTKVTNTFVVGEVKIELDEADIDGSETNVTTAGRDKENEYHLYPAKNFAKDPTVHVLDDSEDCYVFVKVENGIAGIEAVNDPDTEFDESLGYKTIAEQMADNGWVVVPGQTNIFYKGTAAAAQVVSENTNHVVFESFTIAHDVEATELGSYEEAEIVITAYAIQADGFDSTKPADIWAAFATQHPGV